MMMKDEFCLFSLLSDDELMNLYFLFDDELMMMMMMKNEFCLFFFDGGVAIVYERKVKLLYEDVTRLLLEITEAWKRKPITDPTVLPKDKSEVKWLWNSRNKIRFDERKLTIREIQNKVLGDISISAKLSSNSMYNTTFELQVVKVLYVKCCDDSTLGNPGPSGIGVVYRDWEGRVLGTLSKAVGSTTNYMAEVQATVDGVEKTIYKGWQTLWIVSNSSATIKAFTSSKIPWKFRSKWRKLLTSLQAIRFNSTWREANFSADSTAKRRSRADLPIEEWLEGRLDFLTRIEDPHTEYFYFR
ncbi:hypothetical protein GIB67_042365 [Kingdonia uniflora]|uniref:RNase H type-1 domain-containing protein n=1 Tax=Kingdonia uniflora TaxID=39325 RepID=A0A7J7KXC5_9MAGN|nr:hypothetical protein GIB67_042365 [Kingdonia uniflora]